MIVIHFWPTFHKSCEFSLEEKSADKERLCSGEEEGEGGCQRWRNGDIDTKFNLQQVSAKDGEKETEKEGEKKDGNTSQVGSNF